ncbi:MAG: SIR2 family protein [Spirochaetaceae bacterium]|nr:SIR2 family protein [Spirochaetaceae bacterium]
MASEIPLIPEVPQALREAAQVGKLIPFVGAGVSRLAGCPDWDGFADAALNVFVEQGKFNHAQLDQIKHLGPRIKLSMALSLQERFGIQIDFRNLLHQGPLVEHVAGQRLYSDLAKIGKTFVTTNYDEWLDEQFFYGPTGMSAEETPSASPAPAPRTVYHRPEELTVANLNQENVVIHLHGSVKNPGGMVMTTPDYVHHYATERGVGGSNEGNYVLNFLAHLFTHKTVLFVGYGLDELEILEYVILKARTTKGVETRHFLLQGFFSHERELMISLRTYYRECGIHLIPFLKDDEGWDQLAHVLESFGQSVPASSTAVLQEFKEMGALLDG